MPGDQNVNEFLTECQLAKSIRREMGAAIRNQKVQLGWQQSTQGFRNQLGGDLGARHKERQTQAQARAIIRNDQDRNPRRNERQLRPAFPQLLALLTPRRVRLLPLGAFRLSLSAEGLPGFVGHAWLMPLLPERVPRRIFVLALSTRLTPRFS